MTAVQRKWALIVALAGLVVSGSSLARFVAGWATNGLPVGDRMNRREVYGVIGQMYVDGFVAGFFCAFCLVVIAIAVSSWWDERTRSRGRVARASRPRPAPAAE